MKWRPYPRYKDSGVEWLGIVPEGWEILRVKRLARTHLSNVDKHTLDGEQSVRLCNYLDVYKNDKITSGIGFMVASASDEQIRRLSIQRGDVLITKDSETPDDIGVPALVAEDLTGVVCGYHLALLRPYAGKATGGFLNRALQSTFVRAQFSTRAVGMTRYGLGKYDIENTVFAVPSPSEQRAVAAFLDRETARLDTLIAKQERLIELLQEKRQALIAHAVTKGLSRVRHSGESRNPEGAMDPGFRRGDDVGVRRGDDADSRPSDEGVPMKDSGVEWLGKVPAHWDVTRLKYAAERIIDCPHETPEYSPDGEYCVVRTADLAPGVLNLSGAYLVNEDEYMRRIRRSEIEPNDILYGREGERWGFAALAPEDRPVCLGQRMMQFRAGPLFSPQFLMWQINADSTYRQGQVDTVGATSPHVNVETIRNYWLSQPPLAEQIQIANALDQSLGQVDALIAKSRRSIDLLREHRTALISAAVTGKIDVREAA